jgi:hypothetical protein
MTEGFDGRKARDELLADMDREARRKADLFDKLTAKICPKDKDVHVFRRELAEELDTEYLEPGKAHILHIRVDSASHWLGAALPPRLTCFPPLALTLFDISELLLDHDVMFRTVLGKQPSRKELGRGVKPEPDTVHVFVDEKGKRFTQR